MKWPCANPFKIFHEVAHIEQFLVIYARIFTVMCHEYGDVVFSF